MILVLYTYSCSSKIRQFANRQDANCWVADFHIQHGSNADFWVEAVFEGKLLQACPHLTVYDVDGSEIGGDSD